MDETLAHTQHRRSPAGRRFARRTRGVASVEAVVALPFFVLIFVSLFYLRDELLKKHQLSMTARTCAWLYSESNCQAIPAGCQDYLTVPSPASSKASSDLHGKMKDAESRTNSLCALVANVVKGLISDVAEAAFSDSFDAIPKGSVARPALFGGGSKAVSSKYHLECNLAEKQPIDVVTDAWNIVKP
jgi:hypothetical protein